MDWNSYRSGFAAYRSALAQARYRSHIGLSLTTPLAALYERYSDLYRPEAVAQVEALGDGFFTETERRSAQALRDALRTGYVEAASREIEAEIARYEASLRLDWQGQTVTRQDFLATLRQQDKPALRSDLMARWAEMLCGGDDLRAERHRLRQQAAQTLGRADERELWAGVNNINLPELLRGAESFLQQTESFYHAALNDNTARLWPGVARDQLSYADWLYRRHHAQPHPSFPAHDLRPTYSDVLRGLGWRAGQQTNLRLEASASVDTACFAVLPPESVYLVYTPASGVSAYRDFFAVAGQAQHHAWTSRTLREQHPAFVFAPDTALQDGYAALFRAFFYDVAWLREYRAGLGTEQARPLARDEAWLVLAEARRDCALLAYQCAVYDHDDPRDAQELYAEGLTQATGFQHDATLAWSVMAEPFACANRLRGLLLAAALGEYLRVRYGRRWWATRRAGSELTDWWNTGSRYHSEELAPLVGAGTLSFDWLAEFLT